MVFNIGSLDGSNGFITTGTGPDTIDVHGIAVAGLGDVNGDGIDDYLVGSDGGDASVPPNGFGGDLAGRTHIIFGRAEGFPAFIDLTTLDGTNGVTVVGGSTFAQAGYSLGPAGDFNGDGIMDIAIGARNDDMYNYTFEVEVGPGEPDPDSEDGEVEPETELVTIRKHEGAGYVIYGREDWVTETGGAINLRTPPSGVFKLDGVERTPIEQSNPSDEFGLFFGEQVGHSIGGIGDVNDDGVDDLIVGSMGDLTTTGDVFIVFGQQDEFIEDLRIDELDGQNGIRIRGRFGAPGEQNGAATTLIDFNNDGIEDIVFSTQSADISFGGANNGLVTVVYGGQDFSQNGGDFSRTDVPNVLDGFTIVGKPGTNTGWSLDNAGDVNGDGLDDLLIGSTGSNGFKNPGDFDFMPPDSYVIFGRDGGFNSTIDLANLSPDVGVQITQRDFSGYVVSYANEFVAGAGDVNGDGFDDVILGVNQLNRGNGYATVVYGAADFGGPQGVVYTDDFINPNTGGYRIVTSDTHPGDFATGAPRTVNFANAVGGIGDINDDGVDDVAIGQAAFTGGIDGVSDYGPGSSFVDYERGKTSVIYGVRFESVDDITAVGTGEQVPAVTFDVEVSLNGAALNLVTVDYRTQNGTAVAGQDFESTVGTLFFQPGEQSKTITLTILGNDFTEGDEAFDLVFSNAKGAGFGDSPTKTVTVTIPEDFNVLNPPPIAQADRFSIQEDQPLTGNVRANNGNGLDDDQGQGPLTATVVSAPTKGNVALDENGNFTYTPIANENGQDSFTYKLTNKNGGTGTATVTISIAAVGDDPSARDDSFTILQGDRLTGDVTANNGVGADLDVDGDSFTVTPFGQPSNGSVILIDNGLFIYTPEDNFYGDDMFRYILTDSTGRTDVGTVTITVEPTVMLYSARAPEPTVVEGDTGVTTVTFEVVRDGNTDDTGTIDFAIGGGGSAPAGPDDTDGVFPSGTLTFGADETTKTVTVDITGDLAPEPDETLQITLSNATNSAGTDAIIETGTATLTIGNDDDATDVGSSGKDNLKGDDGDDIIFADDGDDKIKGGDGDDILLGGDGDDKIDGGDDDDTIDGGDDDDRIKGGDDDDIITGGAGDDRIDGGKGDDILEGGSGDDELKGGKDDDIFRFSLGDGRVEIADFGKDDDLIDFTGLGPQFDTLAKIMAVADQDGKDAVFDFGADELIVAKTDLDDLEDGDFFIL